MKCTHRYVNYNVSRTIKILEEDINSMDLSKENIFQLLFIKLWEFLQAKTWIHCFSTLKIFLFNETRKNIYYILERNYLELLNIEFPLKRVSKYQSTQLLKSIWFVNVFQTPKLVSFNYAVLRKLYWYPVEWINQKERYIECRYAHTRVCDTGVPYVSFYYCNDS